LGPRNSQFPLITQPFNRSGNSFWPFRMSGATVLSATFVRDNLHSDRYHCLTR